MVDKPTKSILSDSTKNKVDSRRLATWVPLLLAIHFVMVGICMASNLAPSKLQSDLIWWMRPYVRLFHWEMSMVPIELTHGNELDGPFAIQLHHTQDANDIWIPFYPGSKQGDMSPEAKSDAWLRRFNRSVAYSSANIDDKPLMSALTTVSNYCRKRSYQDAFNKIRLVRFIVPSRTDYMTSEGEAKQIYRNPEILYEANLVWIDDNELMLVPQLESHRSSKTQMETATPVAEDVR